MMEQCTLSELLESARQKLVTLEYQPNQVKLYERVWFKFLRYAEANGETVFSEETGARFLKEVYGWPSEINTSYMRHAARAIRVLGDYRLHGVMLRYKRTVHRSWESDFLQPMIAFKQYALSKGMEQSTIYRIEQVLSKLFSYLHDKEIYELEALSIFEIDGFVKTLAGYAPKTLNVSMFALRTFCDWLFESGITPSNLRSVVPSVFNVNRRNVPATWSKEETEKILTAVDRASPCGKRDYAILLLIARLGLRKSDITNLTFENLDWANSRISLVQTKTKTSLILPLLPDIGDAIIDYLRHGRPQSDSPYVFTKQQYPFAQICNIYSILEKHLHRAGIRRKAGAPKGPHTLRHSLAGRLLEKGVTIETICAILGHANVTSTLDYMKIDIVSLRSCAIDPEEVIRNA